jgi:hypothetical protein
VSTGGFAEAAEVDALVERSIDSHLLSVVDKADKAGLVDISFKAVGIQDADILGVPLVDLDLEQFSQPRWVAWTTSTRRGPPTGIRIHPGCGIGS